MTNEQKVIASLATQILSAPAGSYLATLLPVDKHGAVVGDPVQIAVREARKLHAQTQIASADPRAEEHGKAPIRHVPRFDQEK